jgi:hypothetical protein
MRQIRDLPGERPKAGSIDEVELNAACRLAKSLPPLQGTSSVEPSSRERPSREEVSAERQSYRLKVEAFDSTKRELTGIVLEQTQMQPGVFVDAGSSIRQGFPASVKHNPAELKPGVIVVVTEVWRDGLWEIESVRRAQK